MRSAIRESPSVQAHIDRAVKRIVQRFNPEKIILFGSQARGDAGPDSDIDLLVVMDVQGPKRETMAKVRGAVNRAAVPVDIHVTTPEDFAWRKDVVGTIEWPAFREGKVLSFRPPKKERSFMSSPKQPDVVVVREWIEKAENDLVAARHVLKLGREAPLDTICFHAQQCVEKYLKALLVHSGIAFSRTHDIETLVNLVPPALRPSVTPQEQVDLTSYAAIIRYPEAGINISLREARKAVATARRVRAEARRLLPKAALRKRKK